jgi:hypothetical protein
VCWFTDTKLFNDEVSTVQVIQHQTKWRDDQEWYEGGDLEDAALGFHKLTFVLSE